MGKPNITVSASAILALAGIVIAIYLYEKLKNPVTTFVTQTINPVSPNNAIYSGVNKVGANLTGDTSFSLGSWIYSLTHSSYDPNASTFTGGG